MTAMHEIPVDRNSGDKTTLSVACPPQMSSTTTGTCDLVSRSAGARGVAGARGR